MAAVARFLADTSALARLDRPAVAAVLEPRVEAGLVAMCAPVALELLYSSRSNADYRRMKNWLRIGFEWLPADDDCFDRALAVQEQLSKRGQLRAVKLPDLLIAAVAERGGVTVVHYDADFDRIAAVSHQPAEWVVTKGSVS